MPLNRNYIAILHDGTMAALSLTMALYLRLGDNFFEYRHLPLATGLFTGIALAIFLSMRLYRGLWRYASIQDMVTLTKASTFAVLIFFPLLFLLTRLEGMPRSVPLIQWMLLIALLGGPRFVYRFLKDGRQAPGMILSYPERIPVLLVGVNNNTELFLRDLGCRSHYRAVAIIDNDKRRVGRSIHGVRIYGTLEGLPRLIEKLTQRGKRPQKILLTDENLDREQAKYILRISENSGIPLARLPRLTDFRDGVKESLEPRAIAIEDLLGRPQQVHDREAMRKLVENKTVMITGAGGTIGGELSRQIAQFAPKKLILLDASEYQLYNIDREVGEGKPGLARESVIADVRDVLHLETLFSRMKPEIVFHAAALKHVPIAESNPEEAILTNSIGTRNVADACLKHQAQAMVLISTDKAVNPSNIMGATKRLSEKWMQALAATHTRTRFITVRFGNVLGSTGSVVPLFREQLARGGPLTVTHPEMTRYFMTVREAVELVLQAAAQGIGEAASSSHIYVLDMGDPVCINDLALQMIRLAGLRPHEDIEIRYTGLRPGEKLHEALFYEEEKLAKTAHAGIMRAASMGESQEALAGMLTQMEKACRQRKPQEAIALLKSLVSEYAPADSSGKQSKTG